MEVVLLFNGLGNQMSQYAFYLSKKRYNPNIQFLFYPSEYDNQHNGYELDKIFNLKISKNLRHYFLIFGYKLYLNRFATGFKGRMIRKFLKITNTKVLYEDFKTYKFNPGNLQKKSGLTYYYGGWHTENYFNDVKDEVYEIFQFCNNENDHNTLEVLKEIQNKNSVSIHVRRGDYLNIELKSVFGNICNLDYYKKAFDYIHQHVEDPYFYIFSDDKQWVKDNFDFPNSEIVDFNKGENSWKDMYLMSKCKHNINANSTFSWWGAWLNENPNKIVIVPEKFIISSVLIDIYPDNWIRIPVSN